MKTIIKNGRVITATDDYRADILIEDERVSVIGAKLEMKTLKVVGVESVTVPAGTFEAYKVEITSADNDADKTTVWIVKDSRRVAKVSAVLPSLQGAILTSELTQ